MWLSWKVKLITYLHCFGNNTQMIQDGFGGWKTLSNGTQMAFVLYPIFPRDYLYYVSILYARDIESR